MGALEQPTDRFEAFELPAIDPIKLWPGLSEPALFWDEADGLSWLGLGVAAQFEGRDRASVQKAATDAEAWLSAHAGEGNIPPRAFVLMPFEGGAHFVIPELNYIRQGDAAFLVFLGGPVGKEAQFVTEIDRAAEAPLPPPATVSSLKRPAFSVYRSQVAAMQAAIEAGQLRKAVLSRDSWLCGEGFSVARALERLGPAPSGSRRFAFQGLGSAFQSQTPGFCPGTAFLGLSPERLMKREGTRILTEAIAGTRKPDEEASLLQSTKDLEEHAHVVTFLKSRLEGAGAEVHLGPRQLARLGYAVHLKTPIEAEVAEDVPTINLLQELHPTPATAGLPQNPALALIAEVEDRPRGLYAGALGWLNAKGDGDFWVGLRSAELSADRVRLFVGGGIVKDSKAEDEWRESCLKEGALLSAFQATELAKPGQEPGEQA